ncbi:extracellular solute-binding protein [Herbaspirillum huttiense F1]|uniref:ABC transporter substrate-binding protein n=1 Tax=Herbaspirillum huttiense TaxID=863372 RepID=UPI0028842E12|nr:extracellular solute-binding protein [Herbaspirillum huttiense]MDT0356922.1 extracellular solute-binding protein [Herbaspirillum huttiense F1]
MTGYAKRGLRIFIAGVASALLLTACERGDDSGSAATATAAAEPVVLTALVWAPDWSEEMHRVADAFSLKHPEVRINLQFMIGNSVEENLKPRAATDSLPDIVSVNANPYTATLADQGLLADIGDTQAWSNMLEVLQREWTSPGGRRYGIPSGVATTLIYYNRDMFDRAGITAPPADFESFLAASAALRKAGLVPLALPGGFPNMLGNGPFSYGFANQIAAKVPDWRIRIANGTLQLDNADGAAIFARLRTLVEQKMVQADCLRAGYDTALRQFAEGRAAMTFQGSWAAGTLMNARGMRVGVFVPPWNDKGQPLKPVLGSETGFAVAQHSGARQRQAAVQFLDFLYGPGMPIWQAKRQNIPPFRVIAADVKGDPALFALVDQMTRDAAASNAPGLYYSVLPVNTIDVLHPLLQSVLSGSQTPARAARLLQDSITEQARLSAR